MGRSALRWGLLLTLVTGVALAALPPNAGSASSRSTAGRVSGIDFLTQYKPISRYWSDFQRIRDDGANTVSFDVWWMVPSYSASKPVAPVNRMTDSDTDLANATTEARRAGLKVILTPKLVVGLQGGNSGWRGQYNPPDPATFFAGYEAMIDHYAGLAQLAGMSTLVVGSEMEAADQYVNDWRHVISAARQRFAGQIGYEVDWREIPRFQFGDAVDVLLLSAYFPLSNAERPTLAELKAGWHAYQSPDQTQTQDAFSEVSGLAHRWGKPIVFGEGGYTATTYPASEPWWNRPNPTNEPQLQYESYQALLDTFAGQPWWGGVLWWAWNDDPNQRSPEGKPAESLIGAKCVAPQAPAAIAAAQSKSALGQAASSSQLCDRGQVDAASALAPTDPTRLARYVAVGTLALALLATAVFAVSQRSNSGRRDDRRGRFAVR